MASQPADPPLATPQQAADDRYVRVVSWMGEWMCPCETRHFMHHPCSTCDYPSPCRWVGWRVQMHARWLPRQACGNTLAVDTHAALGGFVFGSTAADRVSFASFTLP